MADRSVCAPWFRGVPVVALAVLAACSGGSGSGVTPPPAGGSTGNPGSHARGAAKFVIRIPKKAASTHARPRYISPGTQSMSVEVAGTPTSVFNLTPSSANCAIDTTSGDLTCSESMTIPSGQQTITVTLFDQQNAQGDQLSTATTSVKIPAAGFVTVPITLGGVVATATVLVNGSAAATVPVGVATSLPVEVEAYDASGNLIVPPGNYSAPITVVNSDQSGITSFTAPASALKQKHRVSTKARRIRPADTTTITTPGSTLTLYYNGDPIATAATLTANVNGTPQTGTATLTGTGNPMTQYALTPGGSSVSQPQGIATGPDDALWVADTGCSCIDRITTAGAITYYPTPTANSGVTSIALGPDQALWFTEPNPNQIGRITTAGSITEYSNTIGTNPSGITAGPDGAVWYTARGISSIDRITTDGLTIDGYAPPTAGSGPYGITTGSDGALWFTESNANKIGRITTGGSITEYSIPTNSSAPRGIAAGPDGALWFTEFFGSNIGRITTGGTIAEYSTPSSSSLPLGITAGADGAVWFTERSPGNIARISTGANPTITEYSIPHASGSVSPWGIALGPDKALWFTEYAASQVGRIP